MRSNTLAVVNGSRVGTLCILDHKPRDFDSDKLKLLSDLGRIVETELEMVLSARDDELTNLCNRRHFEVLAGYAISLSLRNNSTTTLLFFDIDHFKTINDQYGHAEGDLAIKCFADLLRQSFRESDLIARIGSDEFIALLNNSSDYNASATAVTRLSELTARFNLEHHYGWTLDFSVGITKYDQEKHKKYQRADSRSRHADVCKQAPSKASRYQRYV